VLIALLVTILLVIAAITGLAMFDTEYPDDDGDDGGVW